MSPTLLGYRLHTLASFWFGVSDMTLGYSMFVSKKDQHLAVMVTYYTAVILFGLAAVSETACTGCLSKAIKDKHK